MPSRGHPATPPPRQSCRRTTSRPVPGVSFATRKSGPARPRDSVQPPGDPETRVDYARFLKNVRLLRVAPSTPAPGLDDLQPAKRHYLAVSMAGHTTGSRPSRSLSQAGRYRRRTRLLSRLAPQSHERSAWALSKPRSAGQMGRVPARMFASLISDPRSTRSQRVRPKGLLQSFAPCYFVSFSSTQALPILQC
jgi:hypothetical protein